MADLEALKKDFADLDWTAAKAENARLREREQALIDELAEAQRRNDELLKRWTGRAMEDVCPKCNHVMLQYAAKGLNSVDCAVCEAQAKIASLKAQVGSGVAALANARSAAIEECREKAKQMGEWGFADVLTRLPPPPPRGRFVANEVMEGMEKALTAAWESGSHHFSCALMPDGPDCNCWRSLVYAMLPANREEQR